MRKFLVCLLVWSIYCVCRCTCSCSTSRTAFDGAVTTYCTWSRLLTVPYHIDNETTKLDLNSNIISSIKGYNWSRLSSLNELDLSSNNFITLKGTSWLGLSSLKKLTIGNNDIMTLIGADWSGLQNLLELHLNRNEISSLDGVSWEGLTSLNELDLRWNKLTSVKDIDWSQLTSLRRLNLGYNRIKLTDASWSGLPLLAELTLYENKINSLAGANWYGLSSVSRLSLSFNHISSLVDANWCGLWSLRKLFLLDNPIGQSCSPSLCIPKVMYEHITIHYDINKDCGIGKCEAMKPVFHVRTPKVIVIKAGQRGSFNMSAIGIPNNVTYSLMKADSPQMFMDNEMLKISDASSKDVGSYVVKAENSKGSTMHFFTLHLRFKPEFNREMPKEIQVNEGKSRSLNLSAVAYPLPILYTLYKDGRQFKQPQIVMDNGMLKIYSISRKDSGSYVLTAKNSEGSTNYSLNLVVRVLPKFNFNAARHIVINEGRSDIFNMSASGIPRDITYTLYKGARKSTSAHIVVNKGMLELADITGKENGYYLLTAENSAGSRTHGFTLVVKLKPVFSKSLTQHIEVTEGQTQIFNMSALGDDIMYTLYKDGVETNTTHIDLQRGGMFEIVGIDRADAGAYILQAENDVGITIFKFTLSVSEYAGSKYDDTIYYVIITVSVVILFVTIIVAYIMWKRCRKSEKRSMEPYDHAEAMQSLNAEQTNEQSI